MSPIPTLRPGSPARHPSGLRRWREGKVRPILGNSPHDRPVSQGISSSLKESLRRSLPRHRVPQLSIILGAQDAFFKAWRNLSGPMGFQLQKPKSKPNPGLGPHRLPLVGPELRQKNAPGGTRSFSSSADEFRPAIPRSGWSPPEPVSASPARTDYHARPASPFKSGTFYFAGNRNFLLCLDSPPGLPRPAPSERAARLARNTADWR